MRRALNPHPDSRCAALEAIDVDVVRPAPGLVALCYDVKGDIAGLRLAPSAPQVRADELWRTTCFEAFVRAAHGGAYYEFNFAPSGAWAAYRFDGYRAGMAPASVVAPPSIDARASDVDYTISVRMDLTGLPDLPAHGPWRLAVTAVIEEMNGDRSYWALTHPAGPPDFHHAGGFDLSLERE